jgi:hypothetical protein
MERGEFALTLHDGVPVPKVIDFGIAKATEGRLTDATVYTQLHQFIGTPAYMSPEQAEMSGLDIDTRSDIYSQGVLLYELLVGSTPFDAKELVASGLDTMRKTIREKEPVRPSTRFATLKGEELTTTAKRRSADTSKLLHQLKGDLDWIVMKCLEKDRTRRYDTANGVAMDLKRHLNNEPVVARPPSRLYEFQKTVRRHKFGFTAAAGLMVGLLNRQRPGPGQRDLRGWEWRYLWQQTRGDPLVTLCQKSTEINSLAVSPDGNCLAVGVRHRDGLLVWDLRTRQELVRLAKNEQRVRAAFSPTEPLLAYTSGKLFAVASDLGHARVWDAATWRPLATLGGFLNGAHSVSFSRDGRRLAIASDGKEGVRIWDTDSRQDVFTLEAPGTGFQGAWFSPDGNTIIWENVAALCVWRAPSWEQIAAAEAKETTGANQPGT